MMSRLLACSVLALALSATGCRDTLVDENGPTGTPPGTAEGPTPYFKGPTDVMLGASASFRVERVEGAEEYRWYIEDASTGRLSGTLSADSGGLERTFNATATESGIVSMIVSVFDEHGDVLASVTKRVAISAR